MRNGNEPDGSIVVAIVLLVLSVVAILISFMAAGCRTLSVEAERSFVVNVKEDPCDFRVIIDGTERFHGWSKTLKCVFNVEGEK
jgi:hypothetical protein